MRIDFIAVGDEAEATKLMLHHLHIAALLFEGTRNDKGEFAKEQALKLAPIEINAVHAFVDNLVVAYEGMEG